ncbi:MAG TPA: hypothetical protein VFB19_15380 [Mycobacterium sp.]|nr:hypothetical protein [Mycobacterium sp.]
MADTTPMDSVVSHVPPPTSSPRWMLHAAVEELRRLWRARRVVVVVFAGSSSPPETFTRAAELVAVGAPAQLWTMISDVL